MDLATVPEPRAGGAGVEDDPQPSFMSNFAATQGPFRKWLNPLEESTSEIIDAFSNRNYAFLDVSVRFRSLTLEGLTQSYAQ